MSILSSVLRIRRYCPQLPSQRHAVVLLVGCALFPLFASATNSINSVVVNKGASGRTVIKVTMKDPLAAPPPAFSVSNPPRIALDFADTENGTGKTVQESSEQGVRSFNVVQSGDRTRLVLNLSKAQTFETKVDGNALLITLVEQSEAIQAPAATVSHFAEEKSLSGAHSIRDIDFRRGRNGEGRVVVELSDNSTGIDIRQQGKAIIVDFLATSLPRNLERRLDVTDFTTPV